MASEKKNNVPEPQLSWQQNVVLYLHDWVYLLSAVLIFCC